MSGPNSREWEKVRQLEDVMGTLASIDLRRATIKRQIWHGAELSEVFKELELLRCDIDSLRDLFGSWWREYREEARRDG